MPPITTNGDSTSMANNSLSAVSAEQVSSLSVLELCASLKIQIAPLLTAEMPVLVGIHRGGFHIAEWLHKELDFDEPLGSLDISWHRDDLKASSVSPHVKPTELPVDIDGREVLLVDDVLHTGRTIRAAMNELFDYGRPAAVRLVVLGCRAGQELPIRPDVVAANFELAENQEIKLVAGASLAVEDWRLSCVARAE